MQIKPDFTNAASALEWARVKYAKREQDLLGQVPDIEVLMMSLIEVTAAQAMAAERIALALEKYLQAYDKKKS